jgi:hypothetical protein
MGFCSKRKSTLPNSAFSAAQKKKAKRRCISCVALAALPVGDADPRAGLLFAGGQKALQENEQNP